jgi:PadR family transcriptional regulator PadR
MISSELLKGSLKTIVLKLLEQNGRMYGYEITRKVEELTRGKIVLTYGALYPVLHKLENEGILQVESENYNNRIRIYYQLTPKGRSVVKEKVQEMTEFLKSVSYILDPKLGMSYERA